MGIASKLAKINMSQPKPNSKAQKEKAKRLKERPIQWIACANCGDDNVTLIKCTDSYYCRACMTKLGKKKYEKLSKKDRTKAKKENMNNDK